MRPIALPLSVAGFHPDVLEDLDGEFRKLGFGPVRASAGGGGGGINLKSEPFKPGSAISLSLVRGDMTMAGVGTVTWVHGDRFIAFGHPFRGVGQELIAAVPSLQLSLRGEASGAVGRQ